MEPESAHPAPSRVRLWIAFASIYLVWGSTYLAIRFAIETVPPLSMAGVRSVVAMLLGWAFAGETLALRTLIAATIALTGVVLIVRARAEP